MTCYGTFCIIAKRCITFCLPEPPGASWSLLELPGASWSFLEPPGASWSLLSVAILAQGSCLDPIRLTLFGGLVRGAGPTVTSGSSYGCICSLLRALPGILMPRLTIEYFGAHIHCTPSQLRGTLGELRLLPPPPAPPPTEVAQQEVALSDVMLHNAPSAHTDTSMPPQPLDALIIESDVQCSPCFAAAEPEELCLDPICPCTVSVDNERCQMPRFNYEEP